MDPCVFTIREWYRRRMWTKITPFVVYSCMRLLRLMASQTACDLTGWACSDLFSAQEAGHGESQLASSYEIHFLPYLKERCMNNLICNFTKGTAPIFFIVDSQMCVCSVYGNGEMCVLPQPYLGVFQMQTVTKFLPPCSSHVPESLTWSPSSSSNSGVSVRYSSHRHYRNVFSL